MSPEARWTGRTDPLLAEIAEALEIPTDMVMGHGAVGGGYVALYTPDTGDASRGLTGDAFKAILVRDADDVLIVRSRERMPGLLDEIRANVERDVRRQMGR